MSGEEISALLDSALNNENVGAGDVKSVMVSADDLMTKVYGFISSEGISRHNIFDETQNRLRLIPYEDETGIWLETADGFLVNYYGMSPQVAAMARFEGVDQEAPLAEFGYFFLFPYNPAEKDKTDSRQVMFSGSLLQEMHDIGADMGVNVMSPDVFEVVGSYAANYVNMRLIDDADSDRYILMLSIEPEGFADADDIPAAAPLAEQIPEFMPEN